LCAQPKTTEAQKATVARLARNENKKRKQLAALGIDYEFPGYAAPLAALSDKVRGPRHSLQRHVSSRSRPWRVLCFAVLLPGRCAGFREEGEARAGRRGAGARAPDPQDQGQGRTDPEADPEG